MTSGKITSKLSYIMNYDPNIQDAVRQIRTVIRDLPSGQRLFIENKLDRISSQSKRAIRRGAWHVDQPHTEHYEQTHDQIAKRESAIKAVMQAMLSGRKVSYLDEKEFNVSQMHTTITKIRRKIEKKNLPYILCDEVFHVGENNTPSKKYWLIPKEEDGIC
ncbi:MAG: hypothetical protein II207_06300 [Clostridia bacterium]|nr:hypothetical protein [Clostridia bacterium]